MTTTRIIDALTYRPEPCDLGLAIIEAQAACDASLEAIDHHPASWECFRCDLVWLLELIEVRGLAIVEVR
jgi:hypothetical protein